MDEYFCPNCNATLNIQAGFDPSCGTWTCTSCGTFLMDEDVYNGTRFEGVAWICDNCGSLLNKQSGFSDVYDSWECAECHHINSISEDEVYESEREYRESKGECVKIECPKCGANLKTQFCYAEYNDEWECTSCGAELYREYSGEPYEEKVACPKCGANLKLQRCYIENNDELECTSCGAELHRKYGTEDYTIVEEEFFNDEDVEQYYATTESNSGFEISEDELALIVSKVGTGIPRLVELSTEDMCVYGKVESLTGLSTWSFWIDFDTDGAYTIRSENRQSNIPFAIAKRIRDIIQNVDFYKEKVVRETKDNRTAHSNPLNNPEFIAKLKKYVRKPKGIALKLSE